MSQRTLTAVPSSAVLTTAPTATAPTVGSGNCTAASFARPGVPGHSRDLLAGSARELLAAGAAQEPESRYAHAHLAALRAAAAVLAARAHPRSRRSGRVRSAWVLLAEVAPELAEWSAFFAAGAGKRAAAEAGLRGVVTEREADDLVREVEAFLALVARVLGVTHQPALESSELPEAPGTRATPTSASTSTSTASTGIPAGSTATPGAMGDTATADAADTATPGAMDRTAMGGTAMGGTAMDSTAMGRARTRRESVSRAS